MNTRGETTKKQEDAIEQIDECDWVTKLLKERKKERFVLTLRN